MSPRGQIVRRRGWCPGVRRPMETGDGLLVRLHPFGGRLNAPQARLIAEAARQYGNGHLDITARGNLQIRGVGDGTYPALLALLEPEGLVEPESDGPSRLTVLSPLAGRDPRDRCDAFALAQAIERKAGAIEGLPAKVFVAVDGGGLMPLDAIGADLHLVAMDGQAVAFALSSPDGPYWIGTSSLARTPDAVHVLLSGFAELRRAGRSDARRLRDLEPDRLSGLLARAALGPAAAPSRREPSPRAGIFPLEGGQAVLLALPFGRSSADQLAQAADWSEWFGDGDIRLSFTRGLMLAGIADAHGPVLVEEAGRYSFITDGGDPRLSLLACPGKPDCGSALTPAPADALRIAGSGTGLLARGTTLHVSGCPKGCAHPGKADLTLVGRDDGRYDLMPNGSTREAASLTLSIDDIMTLLLPLTSPDDLRRVFPEQRP